MVRLHAELDAAPSATYDITTAPPPPLPGAASASASTSLLFVPRHYDQLQPCVKITIGFLNDQLYNRFFSAGPTKTALIAMKSNPFMSWPPFFLTSSICRISEVYFFAKVYTFSIKYILF
jgi:hypothetical protein